jgi:hypothetical protein
MIYFLFFIFIATPIIIFTYIRNLGDDRPDLGGFGGRKD